MLLSFENITYDLGFTKLRRINISGELDEDKTLVIQVTSGVGK